MRWIAAALLALPIMTSTHASATSLSSTPSLSTSPSLGASILRSIVRDAARLEQRQPDGGLDLNGIAWLEHVNLVVGSNDQAEAFYQDFLGCTRDPDAKFHVNLGQQQFHLAATGDPPQRIAGSVGLAVPNLEAIRSRAEEAAAALQGTKFDVLEDEEDFMTVSCPWGNMMHLYCVSAEKDRLQPASDAPQKMVRLHAEGGSYSAERMAVRGRPGIRYVEIACGAGASAGVARFYREFLGCTVTAPAPGRVAVSVGPGIHLIYVESDVGCGPPEEDVRAMEGVHICVYTHDFKTTYDRLATRSLVWTNPRFTHLDSCDTWEEAAASRTLRFKDIVDIDGGEKLVELEHETRPLRHGQYLKVPHYVPK